MEVQTSSNPQTVNRRGGMAHRARQSQHDGQRHARRGAHLKQQQTQSANQASYQTLDRSGEGYPTRLPQPMQSLWVDRRGPVIKGSAEQGPLSQQQLDEFENKGFLFEPNFISGDELALLREELKVLLENDAFRGKDYSVVEPSGKEIRSLFAVHYLSEVFARLANNERLVGRARQILGGETYVHQSRINYKPGFEGKGFNWHSDFETWHAEDGMPEMNAVSASIVLTDNHEFNGPLMLIPGSHRVFVPCIGETPDNNHETSLKKQEVGVPSQEALRQLIERNGIEAPKGSAGGLLLFDCNTLHGSNANMSPDPRSNAFFVYNRVDNRCGEPFAAKGRRPDFLAHEPEGRFEP